MINIEDLYIMEVNELHVDLYRMGNAETPSFSEGRGIKDCRVVDVDGIRIVKADGNGFSAFNSVTSTMKRKGKNIWRLKKGANLAGLKIVKDLRPKHEGHFMIAPERDMPFKKYLGILEEFGLDKSKCVKLTRQEIENA